MARTEATRTPARVTADKLPSPARSAKLLERIAARYHVDPDKMAGTLKATVFRNGKEEISNEQLMMLLIVADQYKLNPFTAEIFAFPSQRGLVPIVSVDGWMRIVNEHEQLSGFAFEYDDAGEWIECIIERKDRSQPIRVREYLVECKRNTGPWQSHPQRMLRHKAFIQAARLAFGFAGVYDQDEGERIIEGSLAAAEPQRGKPATQEPKAIEAPAEKAADVVLPEQILAELDRTGVPLSELLANFEAGDLTELAQPQRVKAMDWIRSVAP